MFIGTFIQGINQAIDKRQIEPTEAYKAENCDVSDGSLSNCLSYNEYNPNALVGGIKRLMKYFHGSTGNIIVSKSGKLYKLLESGFTEIATGFTSDDFDYINYQSGVNEVAILTNGTDNVKVYDGVTFRDLKNDGMDSAESAENKSPKGKFIELHKERVWLSNGNELYFSKSLDADDWTAPVTEGEANMHGGMIMIPSWDSGTIVGIRSLFDDLLVFKTNNVHRIFGYDPLSFSVSTVFNSVDGTIVEKSIASVRNMAFWLTKQGIFVFNGTNAEPIHTKIKDYFKTINANSIDVAVGIIFKNKYILAVPTGSSVVNNMIIEYDLTLNNFVIKTGIEVSDFIEYGNELLFTNSTGKVYRYNTGNVLASGLWESGEYSLGKMNSTKNIGRVRFTASGSGSIRITIITERKTSYKDIVLDATHKPYEVRIRNKGKMVSFKIESLNGASFKINNFTIDVEEDVD